MQRLFLATTTAFSLCVLSATSGSTGCAKYVAPCALESDSTVMNLSALSRAHLVKRPDGTVIASWLRFKQAALGSVASQMPEGFEIVVIGADGTITQQKSVASPAALDARKGSTRNIGAEWTGRGAILHWTEATTQTLADGTSSTHLSTKLQFVSDNGQEGELLDGLSCDDCSTLTSSTPFEDGVTLLHTAVGSKLGGGTSEVPATIVRFDRIAADGSRTASGSVPWLASVLTPAGSQSGGFAFAASAALATSGRHLFVFATNNAWSVDATLSPKEGPIPRPPGAVLAWDPSTNEAVTAWFASDVGADLLGAPPNLYFQRSDNQGRPAIPVQRISTGDAVLAVAAQADHYAVVFSAGGHEYLDLVDRTGNKRGSDLDLGGSSVADPGADAGAGAEGIGTGAGEHLLHAPSTNVFVDIYVTSDAIKRRVIRCQP